ncbi:hypothetical protein STENM327S_00219 [Streptomyces tendae]
MRRLFAGLAAGTFLLATAACGSSDGSGSSGRATSSGGTITVELGLIPVVDVAASTSA